EQDDGRSVLEPAHFLALSKIGAARKGDGPAVLEIESDIEEMQADAGNKHRRDGNHGYDVAAAAQPRPQPRAFVLAVDLLDPPQCGGIDVPGVAGDVGDVLDAAIVRCVETM